METLKGNWQRGIIWLGVLALIRAIIYSTYLEFISTRPRPQIGISVSEVRNVDSDDEYSIIGEGVYITVVHSTPSGENAGLQEGDHFVSIDGRDMLHTKDIRQIVLKHKIGDGLNITLEREGEEVDVPIILTKQINTPSERFDPATP